MIPTAVVTKAREAGLTMVDLGNRVEARTDKDMVIAFHGKPERCLDLALERLEAKRLRELDPLPSDREPDLTGIPTFLDRKVNGIKPASASGPKPGPVAVYKTAPASVPVPISATAPASV